MLLFERCDIQMWRGVQRFFQQIKEFGICYTAL